MQEKNKMALDEVIIFLIMVVSSMMIMKQYIFSLFFVLQVLGIVLFSIKSGKLIIAKDKYINFIFVEMGVSTIFCQISDMSLSYKKGAIVALVLILPIYFTYAYIEEKSLKNSNIFVWVKKGIKITCIIELVWCLLQFLLYYMFQLDINQIIFVDMLKFVETATHYKNDVFLASGLCWHAAFIAPIAVISYIFFENWIIKGLAVVNAIICDNSTAMIAISVCVFLDFCFKIISMIKSRSINKRTIIYAVCVIVIGIPLLLKTGALQIIIDKVMYIFQRVTGKVNDGGSAEAHIRYYTSYLDILRKSSILQIIFGYGPGCSGYPISTLTGQYASMSSWAVESDVMDIILSRGITGFIGFYCFLFKIAKDGLKIDYRYLILILSLAVGGITYNIQFEWVVLIEMLLLLSIKRNYNLFD